MKKQIDRINNSIKNTLSLSLLISFISITSITNCFAQTPKLSPSIPFQISSLDNNSFIATGLFNGELKIYPDFIEVTLSNTMIKINYFPDYKGKYLLKSIRIGLGENLSNGQWTIYSNSLPQMINKAFSPNDTFQPPQLNFLIPKNPNSYLPQNWLIITLEGSNLIDNNLGTIGYCYSHSQKDIFKFTTNKSN